MSGPRSYNDRYGPDIDSEFTFGPRSIYYDEFRADDVSEFTDPTVSKSLLNTVGGYRKTDAARPTAPRPPIFSEERQTRSTPPSEIPINSSILSDDEGDIEEYRDEFENQSNKADQFVERVTEWYSQAQGENDDDDEGRQTLVEVGVGIQSRPVVHDHDKRLTLLLGKLVIACIALFLVSGIAAFAVVFFLRDAFRHSDEAQANTVDVAPTSAPTAVPTPTSAPTAAPTPTPTTASTPGPTPAELVLTLHQTFNGPKSYGASVAMAENWLVIGAPESSKGLVSAFYNDGHTWKFVPEIEGEPDNSFGADVDIVKPPNDDVYVFIGAPSANIEGAATLFKFDSLNKKWQQQGGFLQGKEQSFGSPEKFGASVAISSNFRCVVGAPHHDAQGMNSGRIYTFQYTPNPGGNGYQPLSVIAEPLVGSTEGARFGSDVDISDDGLFIAAGEPGRNSMSIYVWNNSLWLKVFEDSVVDEGDFGTCVKFLSPRYLAVGSPLAESGTGNIRVYEKGESDQTWTLLPILTGKNIGDGIGMRNTVSGRVGPSGPELVLGTAKGAVERYDMLDNRWVRRYYDDRNHPLTAIDSFNTDSEYMVIAGFESAQEALFFSGAPPQDNNDGSEDEDDGLNGPPPEPSPATLAFTTAGSENDTSYGHAVTLVGEFLVVGEPRGNTAQIGNVAIFDRSGSWRSTEFGLAQNTLQFGYSLASAIVNGKSSIIVGAVDTKDEDNLARFGSAHFYEQGETGWNAVGGIIRPTLLLPEAGGAFGASVAMAGAVRRIVVGAPSSSLDLENIDTGRVYTFEYDGADWKWLSAPIIGSTAGQMLGASVDISVDGTRMLIGAPGGRSGDGTAYFYEWKGAEWHQILTMRGANGQREALGSTVKIISEDGRTVAFGGPNLDDKGVIKVFQESESFPGLFLQMGSDIEGTAGERIGGTLSGAKNRIAFGTDTGSFRVLQHNGTTWTEVYMGPSDLGSKVISIDISADANTVAVGLESQNVIVYDLK